MYLFNLLNVLVQAPAQVAQSVVSDFLTSPLTSGSPTLDANVILDNLITSIREDMKQWCDGSTFLLFLEVYQSSSRKSLEKHHLRNSLPLVSGQYVGYLLDK